MEKSTEVLVKFSLKQLLNFEDPRRGEEIIYFHFQVCKSHTSMHELRNKNNKKA